MPWSTKIQKMTPLYGALFVADQNELSLCREFLQYKGIPVQIAKRKNWREELTNFPIFSDGSPELARALKEFGKEVLLFGNWKEEEMKEYHEAGVVFHWGWGGDSLFLLPLFPFKSQDWSWVISSLDPIFDRNMNALLECCGHRVICEPHWKVLPKAIAQERVDLLVLDWDQIPIQEAMSLFPNLLREKEILVIGIKDFDRLNLYRDLSHGISSLSHVLLGKREVFSRIIESFPLAEYPKIPLKYRRTTKFEFELQEHRKPIRLREIHTNELVEPWEINRSEAYRELFRWHLPYF